MMEILQKQLGTWQVGKIAKGDRLCYFLGVNKMLIGVLIGIIEHVH